MVSGVNMPAINVFVSMYYWGMLCRYLFMRWRNDNESTNVCLGTILLCNKYVFVFCRFSHRFIWNIYLEMENISLKLSMFALLTLTTSC